MDNTSAKQAKHPPTSVGTLFTKLEIPQNFWAAISAVVGVVDRDHKLPRKVKTEFLSPSTPPQLIYFCYFYALRAGTSRAMAINHHPSGVPYTILGALQKMGYLEFAKRVRIKASNLMPSFVKRVASQGRVFRPAAADIRGFYFK